ncbi:MAG TPA: hypothetical protein PKI34_01170 [Bacteroidales bacterium]|nr:hypothetical protein [Bacteroidales bacterium]
MKTDLVFKYLKWRAQIEGVPFELGQKDFFEPYFKRGVRKFFGVLLDDNGFPINDEQEPKDYPGLLTDFITANSK